ncbi:uncharacterized protein LOC125259788 [Megalobrama amblycephala]|uniref:uncharacterized protein LOC125259788 n=1 Tax=Megalobrama amblycephala TaxID=75352 RepID=UPI0020141A1C|nr:uncharacterized protein LOC125259788 [Megalobrama amblycephala]
MTARVYCAVLLCLSGRLSTTDAAPGPGFTVPGYSPGKVTIVGSPRGCASDRDCSRGYRCSGAVCVPPAFSDEPFKKPGVCPIRQYAAEMCARIRFRPCADDSDCANNEKCCSNGCGRQCMPPVIGKPTAKADRAFAVADPRLWNQMPPDIKKKPGVCPRRQYEAAMCPRIRFRPCADDSDCANNEKCCSNGCGLQCMPPVTGKPTAKADRAFAVADPRLWNQMPPDIKKKPGVCPRRQYEAEMCPRIRFRPCADDSDCANNEKCCSNGCGLQCMPPVIDIVALRWLSALTMTNMFPNMERTGSLLGFPYMEDRDDGEMLHTKKISSTLTRDLTTKDWIMVATPGSTLDRGMIPGTTGLGLETTGLHPGITGFDLLVACTDLSCGFITPTGSPVLHKTDPVAGEILFGPSSASAA